jgi:hypothetical protein
LRGHLFTDQRNFLLVFVNTNGTATISSVTDNAGAGSSTYASIFNGACNTPGGYNCGLFYTCSANAGATTITANLNVADAGAIIVREYSGMKSATCNDKVSAGATGNSSAQTAGSAGVTTQASELIVGAFLADGSSPFAGSVGYSTVGNQNCVACASELGLVDQIVAATGTYSATSTTGASVTWNGHTATFKGAAGTGPNSASKGWRIQREVGL